jgi:hypothetical protein
MIATTISNSINEKPFCLRILCYPSLVFRILGLSDPIASTIAVVLPQR